MMNCSGCKLITWQPYSTPDSAPDVRIEAAMWLVGSVCNDELFWLSTKYMTTILNTRLSLQSQDRRGHWLKVFVMINCSGCQLITWQTWQPYSTPDSHILVFLSYILYLNHLQKIQRRLFTRKFTELKSVKLWNS